jgi:hypothetical protein
MGLVRDPITEINFHITMNMNKATMGLLICLGLVGPIIAQSINVTSTGVGIGTTNPAQRLQVQVDNKGLNLVAGLRNMNGSEDGTNAVGIGFLNDGGGNWWKAAIVHKRTSSYGVGSLQFLVNNELTGPSSVTLSDTRMTITPSGNIGIGTTTPSAKVSVSQVNSSGWSGNLDAFEVTSPDAAFRLTLKSYIIGAGNVGYNFTPNGVVAGLVISTPGYVGIGTLNPTHKLTVNGSVKSKGFITDTSNWSDYVFAPGYKLSPLSEVEAHIREKKHLPGVPSEAELVKDGLDLGEMSKVQMAQIEQLMLHVIALNKQVQAQAKQAEAQAKRISELEAGRKLR